MDKNQTKLAGGLAVAGLSIWYFFFKKEDASIVNTIAPLVPTTPTTYVPPVYVPPTTPNYNTQTGQLGGGTSSIVYGCKVPRALNYNPNATHDSGNCQFPINAPDVNQSSFIYGCTNPNATNYNPNATSDNGSCTFPAPAPQLVHVYGCSNPNALNYNPNVTTDDGSCTFPAPPPIPTVIYGCKDTLATNFNPNATYDNGSCQFPITPTVITDVTDPVLTSAVVDYDNDSIKIEIIKRVSATFNHTSSKNKYVVVANLRFTNNTTSRINLSTVIGMKASLLNGTKTLGYMAVSLPALYIEPTKSIEVNNVVLNEMGTSYTYLTSTSILKKVKLDVYNKIGVTGVTDTNDVPLIATGTTNANEYTIIDSSIKVNFIHENSSKAINLIYNFNKKNGNKLIKT
jgi:hypothetical protein